MQANLSFTSLYVMPNNPILANKKKDFAESVDLDSSNNPDLN